MAAAELQQLAEQAAARVVHRSLRGQRLRPGGPKVDDAPLGERDPAAADVVARHPVEDRVGARRVVAHDATNRGAVAGRRVGAEHQPVLLELAVEQVQVDPRLHRRGPRLRVHLKHP